MYQNKFSKNLKTLKNFFDEKNLICLKQQTTITNSANLTELYLLISTGFKAVCQMLSLLLFNLVDFINKIK